VPLAGEYPEDDVAVLFTGLQPAVFRLAPAQGLAPVPPPVAVPFLASLSLKPPLTKPRAPRTPAGAHELPTALSSTSLPRSATPRVRALDG
jgi:hypothetical protein